MVLATTDRTFLMCLAPSWVLVSGLRIAAVVQVRLWPLCVPKTLTADASARSKQYSHSHEDIIFLFQCVYICTGVAKEKVEEAASAAAGIKAAHPQH